MWINIGTISGFIVPMFFYLLEHVYLRVTHKRNDTILKFVKRFEIVLIIFLL